MSSAGLILWGKGGGAPPAPDYTGAAEATGAASEKVATQQTYANRPNQYSPFGATTWQPGQTIDPGTGQPVTSWDQISQLNPQAQAALDSQLALTRGKSDLAQNFMGRVAQDYSQPYDWSNLPGMSQAPQAYAMQGQLDPTTQSTNEAAFADQRNQYTQAAMDYMRPEFNFQEEQVRTRLANQGLTPGSEAYNRELGRLHDAQSAQQWNAVKAGGEEQLRMQQMLLGQQGQAFGQQQAAGQFYNQGAGQQFGQDLQSASFQNALRQQAIAEQAQQRGMSLNEMNALLTGQQVSPTQMPSFTGAQMGQGTNYLGAAQATGNYGLSAAAQQAAAQQAEMQGYGSLAGMAMMAAYMSDARLKSNVVRVGTHPRGIGIYEYDILGQRERGVMAQELMLVAPELVHKLPNGYLMVNYGAL